MDFRGRRDLSTKMLPTIAFYFYFFENSHIVSLSFYFEKKKKRKKTVTHRHNYYLATLGEKTAKTLDLSLVPLP